MFNVHVLNNIHDVARQLNSNEAIIFNVYAVIKNNDIFFRCY